MTAVNETLKISLGVQQEEELKGVLCLGCLTSSNFTAETDAENTLELKKKLFEITKLDASYLYLNNSNCSFCKECQKKIKLLEELFTNFENVRQTIKSISTDICRAVLQANLKMGNDIAELISKDFQGWNARRIREMLAEKNCDMQMQVAEAPSDVIMIHYDGDIGENLEIPDILISQLYEDFRIPAASDCILGNPLSSIYENVAIQIGTESTALSTNENLNTEIYGGISTADAAISNMPELTDNIPFLDESGSDSFLQFQGMAVGTNSTEVSAIQEQIPMSSQQINDNQITFTNSNALSGESGKDSVKDAAPTMFKCSECDRTYTRRYRLRDHIKKQHNLDEVSFQNSPPTPKKVIMCSQCSKTFTRTYGLRQHEKKIHGKELHLCEKCPQTFLSAKLLEYHKKKHESKTIKCPICNTYFFYMKSLKVHLQKHYASEAPVVNCDKCGLPLNSLALIMQHIEMHTGDHVCSFSSCRRAFKSAELLEDHLKQHVYKSSLLPCPACDASFEDASLLQVHMADHNLDSYLCDECGESFPTKNLLTNHAEKHKQYNCDICQKVFHKKWNFKMHLRVHSGEKPFKCQECNMSFVQKSSLTAHLRKHAGDLPFKCPHCSQTEFSYQVGLRKHLALYHKESYLEAKKFLCEVCWKNFSKEKDLSKHMKTHEKLKCKLCQRQFEINSHLQEHLLRHAGIKPYKCPCCEKSFIRKKFLADHLKKVHPTHTGNDEIEGDQAAYIITIST